jgi:MOSC domain-containing protein YiiM
MGILVHLARTQDHPRLEAVPEDTPEPDVPASFEDAVAQLEANVDRLTRSVATLDAADWERRITVGEQTEDIAWIVGHAVHDATHHLKDAGRGFHALGAGAPTQHGVLVQVNTSAGGVPKHAIDVAKIGPRGVEGDRQADRKHHGLPLQALCLWSTDVIDALRGEGHPIHAGAAGENLTLSGIDWSTIRPGVRIRIGAVLVEVSAYTTPCRKNARWFADLDHGNMDHERHPGRSRVYAWVLRGGEVRTGDAVVVEP